MIIDEIKKDNVQAIKDKNMVARAILGVAISKHLALSIEKRKTGAEMTDADMIAILQKTIKELTEEKEYSIDYMWYLWCGADSPSFDKAKMATFERYLTSDKVPQKEQKGYYYQLSDNEDICNNILAEFGLFGDHTHIINGHVPVKIIKGENNKFILSFEAFGKNNLGNVNLYIQKTSTSMDLMFDASKLKTILSSIASLSKKGLGNSLNSLLNSYNGICIGFKMSKTGKVEGESESSISISDLFNKDKSSESSSSSKEEETEKGSVKDLFKKK